MKGRTGLLFSLIIAAYFCGIAAQTTECVTIADIVFLVDGSSSISSDDFQKVRTFLSIIIKALDIGPNKIRVGLAQYSDEPFQEFLLKDHMDKRSLLTALERLSHRKGDTETGKAIDFLLTQYFTEEAGSRASQRVPQIAVVITDGESRDDVEQPAQRLRKHGVIVFGIGVGQANRKQLESVANWPPHRFLLTIDSFGALEWLTEGLLQTVCVLVEEQRQALADRFADIFFLVDSGIVQGQFSLFKTELTKLVNQLDAGASTYRIGLAQYGQDIKVEFLLDAFQTKQETLAGVKRFRLQRPQPDQRHNLGSALEYARTQFFTSEAGGRAEQGSRQFLVIVSGKAIDRVSKKLQMIKSAGVTVIGVSAGAPMHAFDLLELASDQHAFDSARVTLLKDIFMTEKKEGITEDCKGANVADIVFIVDESGSIGKANFQLVRNFLHSIVSSLNVSQTRVRVGIVTYSETPTAQVYLDTFNDKTEILQFIKILPYSKGKTNTGEALNFTRDYIFTEQKGSRKDVQQVAVVITDGESQDDVSKAALLLRRTGVTVFAIGIKNAKESELKEMANHPYYKHVFSVESYTHLKYLKESLQRNLCNNIIEQAFRINTRKTDVKEACGQKDEADIFFLMDDSGSIEDTDFYDMKRFIIDFLHIFHIGPQHVRMGLVKYANSPTLEFNLTTHTDANALEKAVEGIHHLKGGTETGKALSSMGPYFETAVKTRGHKVRQYLIVITDGASSDKVKAPAEKLRAQGIIIYAVGVKESNRAELDEISGDPERTSYVTNFDALKTLNIGIITDICSPDVCKDVSSDVMFLTDSSGSISDAEYLKMKEFMKSVINKSAIGQKGVHVGVMQFSTNYDIVFSLTSHFSKDEMLTAIEDMQQIDKGTHTGKAITAVSKYFDKTSGGRPELKQMLVVITDGGAQDEVKGPAAALRAKGVVIYAIGVKEANTTQLLEISGSKKRVYAERDYEALKDLENLVALQICEKGCKKIEKVDIIFLVGSSASKEFNNMQKFMESIVDLTIVGKNQTRFGVILYSDNAESVFTLDTYDSKQEILKAITAVEPLGGNTNTAKALAYSLQFFNTAHGGRAANNVSQILMVITDRDASDRYDLKAPSDALHKNGVTVFSIGVKNATKNQLEIMAGGDTSKVFHVDNYGALKSLYRNVSPVLCSSTKPVCKKGKVDLVFLLDKSSSITSDNYTIMLNFTSNLVNSFKVDKESVHVGVAQFSDDPKHEFYLNESYNKKDVIAHIHKMKQSGGNTNIGKALVYIKDYFTASLGSRAPAGISQNLVLITDGDSHDDVEDAANHLKEMGVEIFAIGVGDVHDLQLLQITGTPQRLFNVQNFDSLANIKQQVVNVICDSTPRPNEQRAHDCSIDIAIGFDFSQNTGSRGEMLVGGHTKLQTVLPEIVNNISFVHGLCCLNTEVKTGIAFQVVDSDGRSRYDTNFEEYSEDVLKKVMTLSISEPTYFNTALLNSFKKKFESRGGVKVLVIFSDGLDEDVRNLMHESELLRKSNISALLTVALEEAHNPAQLQMVGFGRGFNYDTHLSINMPNIGSTILKQIDAVSDRECCGVMCKCWGHEGNRGSWGPPGPKGEPGQRGQPGFLGEDGLPGYGGQPGPNGPQGSQGCPGDRGQRGYRGVSGNRGEKGEDGLDGLHGEQGATGLDGGRGERGHPGNPGIPGIKGEVGLKGERGLRGDPGEPGTVNTKPGNKGEPGNHGLPGTSGPDGLPGEDGVLGYPGQDGRRGQPGEKGGPGDPGDPGIQGSPGAPGPQGRRGSIGEHGPKGIFGFPGPQGGHGQAGDPGQVGRRGANGQKGQPGNPGVKGSPGSQGPRGMPGQDGKDGHGPAGPKGAKGDPGFPGYPGLLGDDGQKGTKGYPGREGNRGRGGNSGRSGESGKIGDVGHPGHRGSRGPPGDKGMTECGLITYIRDNCACCHGRSECPAYPTELVFGLDMSKNVTLAIFERQRNILLSLLGDISIAESNCPTGARVAVVGYNTHIKYLIRFKGYRGKTQLIESVKNIALERTSDHRLGAAMRFVGQNVFKRTRAGAMMRKVAVFFSYGPSQDVNDIVTAMMEYRALNIVPAVISLRNAPAVSRAMEVDDTGHSIFTVLDLPDQLRKIKDCAICFDPCKRAEECAFIQEPAQPQEVDVDLVMVVDSSREMQADEYAGVQQLLGSIVEQLAVSPQPRRADNQARVAVVQQSGTRAPKVEFGLQVYQNHQLMKRHLVQNMQQQSGSSVLGQTLEFALKEVLLKASHPRRRKALLTVVGTQTAYEDRAKLRYFSQKAKCEGVALFVVTVGERYERTQVEELASLPVQQHLIHVGRLKADEQGYVQRFFRVFLSALNKGTNSYPPPPLKRTCDQLTDQDQMFFYSQGSGELGDEVTEEVEDGFQEQMGIKTRLGQLDVINTVTREDRQKLLSTELTMPNCSNMTSAAARTTP